MEFKEIRKLSGLKQKEFSEKYHIPLPTIKDWERGARKPAEYVRTLLERIIREDSRAGITLRSLLAIIGDNETIEVNIDPKYHPKNACKRYTTPCKDNIEGIDLEVTDVYTREDTIYIMIGHQKEENN